MGKSYKGKTCVYCGTEGASQSGDHVFAREFFQKAHRANLPKVPSCDSCNRAKSALEHYLLTILPFGGRQEGSSDLLGSVTPPRLAKNAKLHKALADGSRRAWVSERGLIRQTLTLPIDSAKLEALFVLVARGLAAHHWNAKIPQEYFVGAGVLSQLGEASFEPFLRGKGRARVGVSLGNGLVEYEGLQSLHDPFLTIWRFRLYGGVVLSGDPRAPGEASAHVWAMSVRNRPPGLFDGS